MSLPRVLTVTVLALVASACQPAAEPIGADLEPLESAQHQCDLDDLAELPGHGPLIAQTSPLVKSVYAAESKAWLRWAMGLPFSTGPITDQTGAACAQGQSGPVWYLAGTNGGDVTRSCTIPHDKLIFIPLINHWIIPTADSVAAPSDMADYLDFANFWIPDRRAHTCQLSIELDGAPLLHSQEQLDKKLWTQVLSPFAVQVNDDNFGAAWGRPGGLSPAATIGGHYALLRPLSHGNHTLRIAGATCEDDGTVAFETSALYHLTVSH